VPDRLEALEAQVATLVQELELLRRRVASLEPGDAAPGPVARRRRTAAPAGPPSAGAAPPAADAASFAAAAPLTGRMFLLLAGAFVLRALTDAAILPAAAGVALGLAYAGAVLALAARTNRPAAASFHALTAVLVGFPLLLEATTRFQLLGPALAAALLAVLSGAVLGVAARRQLEWVAWVGTAAALATAFGLMLGTGRLVPPALALVALGLLTLWLGYLGDWHGLRWPVAAAADVVVLAIAARAAASGAVEGPALAQVTAAILVVAYLGSFAARTLYLGRGVVAFEVAQTAGALAAGLGGAAWVAARSGAGTAALGAVTLALAAGAYAVAFAFVERRQRGSANFAFYASVALAFLLAGTWLALPGAARGAALGVLALVASALGRARRRRTLTLHAAVFAVVAAASAGLVSHTDRTLFSSAAVAWPALPTASLGVLACLAAAALLAARGGGRATLRERAPQAVLDLAVALAGAGVVGGWVAGALGPPGPEADLAMVGTGRTAVLAGGALLAAWLGRSEAGREAGWLAWPLVAVLGLKLLLEDLPRGRPATLILSLALLGAALMLVPRLRSRPPSATPPPEAPAAGRSGS